MLALGKSEEGAYSRDRYISVWRPLPTVECHGRAIYVLSLVVDGKVRHSRTQIARLLAVATVLSHGLEYLHFTVGGGEGAYLRDSTVCAFPRHFYPLPQSTCAARSRVINRNCHIWRSRHSQAQFSEDDARWTRCTSITTLLATVSTPIDSAY